MKMPVAVGRGRFSRRAFVLFVTTAAMAMAMMWPVIVLRQYAATERIKKRFVNDLRGQLQFDYEFVKINPKWAKDHGVRTPWQRYIFGTNLTRQIIGISVSGSPLPSDMKLIGTVDSLQHLSFGSNATDELFLTLPPLPGLRHLQLLGGEHVTNRSMEHLSCFPQLRVLDVSDSGISDSGLVALAGLDHLEYLDLMQTAVTGSEMPPGDQLPRLQVLRAMDTEWTDAGAERLTSIKSLEDVDLVGTPITDRALESLALLPRLRRLRICATDVSGAGMVHIAKMAALEELDVSGIEIDDDQAAFIAKALDLDDLNLSDTLVSDSGVARLAALKRLWRLNLDNTRVSDRGITAIASLPSLAQLSVAHTNVTDRGLAEITKLRGLTTLNLSGSKVTMAGLRANLPKLLSRCNVDLLDLPWVGSEEAKELGRLLQNGTIRWGCDP